MNATLPLRLPRGGFRGPPGAGRVAAVVETTSTTGEAPVTVTVSCRSPTFIWTSSLAANDAVRTMSLRRTVLNPDNVYVAEYVPIGSAVSRYSPSASVTAAMLPTCRAGLVAVTVTPGRTPPLSSVTMPTMLASWAYARVDPSNRSAKLSTRKRLIKMDLRAERRSQGAGDLSLPRVAFKSFVGRSEEHTSEL